MSRTEKNSLSLEITIVLVVKIALIFALWWFFFRTPDAPTPQQVGNAVLQPAPAIDNNKEH